MIDVHVTLLASPKEIIHFKVRISAENSTVKLLFELEPCRLRVSMRTLHAAVSLHQLKCSEYIIGVKCHRWASAELPS